MEYELAKELKDNNFKTPRGIWFAEKMEYLPAPTLSELIEACLKIQPNTDSNRFVLWFNGEDWSAGYYEYGNEDYIDCYPDRERGKTLEESVARLWLVINKK